jgi:Glycosyltransferase
VTPVRRLESISILSPQLYPYTVNAPSNIAYHEAKHLSKHFDWVTLYVNQPPRRAYTPPSLPDNVELRVNNLRRLVNPSIFIKLVADSRLVHTHFLPSPTEATTLIPLLRSTILTHHGSLAPELGNARRKAGWAGYTLKRLQLELLKRGFKKIIVPSTFMAQHAELEGFKRESLAIIANGVELDLYRGGEALQLEGEPPILWVGYTKPSKGSHIMIALSKKLESTLPKARIHFVGYYNQAYASELSRRSVNNIVLHGPKSPFEMPKYYRGAWFTLNPSLFESFSMVTLESLASSRPVITVDNGAARDLVTHGQNGYISQPDPEELAQYVYTLSQDQYKLREMSENAFKSAQNYDWSNVTTKLVELLRRTM